MYNYLIYDHDDDVYLQHEKQYTGEEFNKLCNEAPMFKTSFKQYRDVGNIVRYLVNNYGFKEVVFEYMFFAN